MNAGSRATERAASRLAQQVAHSVENLRPRAVQPIHDISISGITSTGTTWTLPFARRLHRQPGRRAGPPHNLIRPLAALEFQRAKDITVTGDTFTHLGGVGVAFADGTQESSITRNTITDTGGPGD
ncbi:hypothetical protein [Kutzneria sp. NPDC052558]|uniref:hypothetical protein n=1 Tax=Kutzneria sp. NPDC052558 TaxID=3364121 RepID=UPI0037C750FF